MTAFPQYASTTDPRVLAVIQRNKEGFQAFRERAFAFATAHGAPDGAYFGSSFAGGHAISAIGGDEKPTTGQWKEGYRRGWLPFKNNPLAKQLEAIRFDEEPVPGLPQLLESATRDGSRRVASPLVFVLDEVAYSGVSFLPEDDGGKVKPEDGGWEEIKASEFHKGLETYNERIGSKK
ncbi:hypothetical protein [Microbacterium sp. Leaf320]|uniref:hypothetical protein n=1 Tax=Microbacterium sp. Leaf320 TaxID=1736334 RepID=UPI0006F98237|nr:hypothetical protein [Microbacterium sp. Leaf320]KQQ65046.1 hypothetical protein ASF63_13825 [Microbacterium sp. Leaf320]